MGSNRDPTNPPIMALASKPNIHIAIAETALNEAASGLRSISRGHGWPVRLYCRFARYDLEAAASRLVVLHKMTGQFGLDDEARQIALDAIYIFLRAHQHLSRERVDEIKMRIGLGLVCVVLLMISPWVIFSGGLNMGG